MLRLFNNKRNIAKIIEEIVEVNSETNLITRYCVIVERAACSLSDLLNIWIDPIKREKQRDWFTPEKLAYIFY